MQIDTEQLPRARKEIKFAPGDDVKFWIKVDKSSGPDGCWLWKSWKNEKGYGRFRVNRKAFLAHRVSYTIVNGQIPHDGSYHGICVCHRCDNPLCVNPRHLFLGKHIDNMIDRETKGRGNHIRGKGHFSKTRAANVARGDRHGRSKLTSDQVKEIRGLYASGDFTHAKLGVRFGINKTVIGDIVRRQTWTHI